MSGLVDMWTSELAKLRSKGQASVFSDDESAPNSREAGAAAAAAAVRGEDVRSDSVWWPLNGLAMVERVKNKLPVLQCSEASLSMIVDSFSA